MTGTAVLTDFLALMDKNANDTAYRALALIWLDLIFKDIGGRQDGFHFRFLEAQTYFATALNDYDYALTTIATDIDTTKVCHVYDKINDITYRYIEYDVFKRYVADEASVGGNPYIFTIFAGNLLLYPTPNFTPITGTADGTTADKLVDSTASFTTDGTTVGMVVSNTTDGTKALVTAIDDANTLSIDSDIFVSGNAYSISWAINLDYIKVITAAADSSATILIPDKYKAIVYDGLLVHGFKFDPEMGNAMNQQQVYEAGVKRMRTENGSVIADLGRPVSHRAKHDSRNEIDGKNSILYPLGGTNF